MPYHNSVNCFFIGQKHDLFGRVTNPYKKPGIDACV
jgi:hypothetical protein